MSHIDNTADEPLYPTLDGNWGIALASVRNSEKFKTLRQALKQEYESQTIYPPARFIFKAFELCPPESAKVVILGQDPYHGPGQAHGLAFSVNEGVPIPPSLNNIFKEVSADTGAGIPETGNLTRWAGQGVLLLNSVLTVREGKPKSHAGMGWEELTDAAIKYLSDTGENIVFLLWGADAIRKSKFIDPSKHLVLTSPHPSPLSAYRGFFGNRHFSRANEYLQQHGKAPIKW